MINILLKLGGLQALILVVFLFRKKANNRANVILAVLVFFLGISCLMYSFNNLEFYVEYPHLIRVDWGIPLLFGPLIYLHTVSLTNSEKSTRKMYQHFVPYVINLAILTPFFLKPSEEKIQILDYFTASITTGTDTYFLYSFILRFAIFVVSISYAVEGIKVLRNYKQKLLSEYSNTGKQKLDWLRILLYSFMAISLVYIVATLMTFRDRYPQFDYNIYYYLLVFVLIYVLSYKTLSLPQIVSLSTMEVDPEPKINEATSKKNEDLSREADALKTYMLTEKPYLNGELTASELARSLQMSRHQLSQILNDHIGKNFYDFINEYRAEEFKNRLQLPENEHLTLLGIAFDSGFNSKTTFNTIFKKMTGLTPSQYKKSLK